MYVCQVFNSINLTQMKKQIQSYLEIADFKKFKKKCEKEGVLPATKIRILILKDIKDEK